MNSEANLGVVYLVGAGSGDPGLITVKGAKLLASATVVVYDYLSNVKLLEYAPRAEHLYVGKKAAAHSATQDQINQLLIEKARDGHRVVRLKGGDPYVFGRGGEEGLALREAGIAFEVVPGVTAAIAAPAYAGIPVTHRDFNSSFTIITGHEKEEDYKDPQAVARGAATGSSDVDWDVIAKLPAIAFYMGVKALPRICENLVSHGMDAATPAATIQWGTTPQQRKVIGTVGDLAEKVASAGIGSPAITIVGKVVSLHEELNWFDNRPLFGKSIIVTRTRQQASDLTAKLEVLGANVLEAPTIEIVPAPDQVRIDAALENPDNYDWVIFTSANGVRYTRDRLRDNARDARVFHNMRIAAIGDATAAAVRDLLCLRVDLVPSRSVAEALSDELAAQNQVEGMRFLLLRADIARPVLRERLQAGGAAVVDDIPIYETRTVEALPDDLLAAVNDRSVDWVTFTSSSTARNFCELLGPEYLSLLHDVKIASIGPVTSKTIYELGLTPTVEAEAASIDALVRALMEAV